MDKQKISQMAAQIATATETIAVSGEFNRNQLSGIYRTAVQMIAEMEREDTDG